MALPIKPSCWHVDAVGFEEPQRKEEIERERERERFQTLWFVGRSLSGWNGKLEVEEEELRSACCPGNELTLSALIT